MSPQSAGGSNHASPASQAGNINPAFTSFSTTNNMHGFASTLPQMNSNGTDPFGDLFSPSILKGAAVDANGSYFNNGTNGTKNTNDVNGGDSTAGLNRVFQFNSTGSTSDSASPSNSSGSQWNANANSSCGTSPEPSYDSPANKSKGIETINENGILADPSPMLSDGQFGALNGYSVPSLDSFDPVLFGDYRDTQDAILGGGDFTGGFFDDALNPAPFDMASPSNLFGILQSPQQMNSSLTVPNGAANAPSPSKNLMAEMDKARDGGDDDYGLPISATQRTESGKLISCNNIWSVHPSIAPLHPTPVNMVSNRNQLQSNPDFQDGKFDLDGLCSELRAKARCSESGVMVDQQHVDAALRKLGKKDEQGKMGEGSHHLMFEQESWDNVLRKLGGNQA